MKKTITIILILIIFHFRVIMKHKSDLKFCSCRQCKRGMRSNYGSWFIQSKRRAYRRSVNQMLHEMKLGKIDYDEYVPDSFSVGYTD